MRCHDRMWRIWGEREVPDQIADPAVGYLIEGKSVDGGGVDRHLHNTRRLKTPIGCSSIPIPNCGRLGRSNEDGVNHTTTVFIGAESHWATGWWSDGDRALHSPRKGPKVCKDGVHGWSGWTYAVDRDPTTCVKALLAGNREQMKGVGPVGHSVPCAIGAIPGKKVCTLAQHLVVHQGPQHCC